MSINIQINNIIVDEKYLELTVSCGNFNVDSDNSQAIEGSVGNSFPSTCRVVDSTRKIVNAMITTDSNNNVIINNFGSYIVSFANYNVANAKYLFSICRPSAVKITNDAPFSTIDMTLTSPNGATALDNLSCAAPSGDIITDGSSCSGTLVSAGSYNFQAQDGSFSFDLSLDPGNPNGQIFSVPAVSGSSQEYYMATSVPTLDTLGLNYCANVASYDLSISTAAFSFINNTNTPVTISFLAAQGAPTFVDVSPSIPDSTSCPYIMSGYNAWPCYSFPADGNTYTVSHIQVDYATGGKLSYNDSPYWGVAFDPTGKNSSFENTIILTADTTPEGPTPRGNDPKPATSIHPAVIEITNGTSACFSNMQYTISNIQTVPQASGVIITGGTITFDIC